MNCIITIEFLRIGNQGPCLNSLKLSKRLKPKEKGFLSQKIYSSHQILQIFLGVYMFMHMDQDMNIKSRFTDKETILLKINLFCIYFHNIFTEAN